MPSEYDDLDAVTSVIIESASPPSDTTINSDSNGNTKRSRSKRSRLSLEPETRQDVEDAPPPAYAEMGAIMSQSITATLQVLGGPDWKPEQSESDAMTHVWGRYFEAKGITEIKPEFAIILVHAGYVGKRLSMPTTKTKVISWWKRTKARIYGSRPDSGHDGIREDDPSYQTS